MIAQHTVEEARPGYFDGKYLKISRKNRATLMDIVDDNTVDVIEEDPVPDRQVNRPDRCLVAFDWPSSEHPP